MAALARDVEGRAAVLAARVGAVEERARYQQQRNCFYGFCREHTPGGKPLSVRTLGDTAAPFKETVVLMLDSARQTFELEVNGTGSRIEAASSRWSMASR